MAFNINRYSKAHPTFNKVLDQLEKKFFHVGGDEDAEVIINWNKREAKEENVISIYATNSVISSAIKRCRPGIQSVDVYEDGATLYFRLSAVRPLHTVLKVINK
jgi:hypothetical protein